MFRQQSHDHGNALLCLRGICSIWMPTFLIFHLPLINLIYLLANTNEVLVPISYVSQDKTTSPVLSIMKLAKQSCWQVN